MIIDKGTLRTSKEELVNFEMKFLDESYIDEILSLQKIVHDRIENKDLFVPDSRDFILNQVLDAENGRAIGVFVDNKLIAFRTTNFPKDSETNMGRELNIPEDELNYVVHLEATVVHPNYRGNRLQERMLKHTIELIKSLGFKYLLSTVSPLNYPSLKSVINSGLRICSLDYREGVYEGKWRFLLGLFLDKEIKTDFEDIVKVDNDDFNIQINLLKESYIGYKLEKKDSPPNFYIYYGK